MASLTTDITTEYIIYRDMTNHHANGVGALWMSLREKSPEQHLAMKKIVRAQKSLQKRFQALHASLEQTSQELTQSIINDQCPIAAAEPQESQLVDKTIQPFYGPHLPEAAEAGPVPSTSFEGTQQ